MQALKYPYLLGTPGPGGLCGYRDPRVFEHTEPPLTTVGPIHSAHLTLHSTLWTLWTWNFSRMPGPANCLRRQAFFMPALTHIHHQMLSQVYYYSSEALQETGV